MHVTIYIQVANMGAHLTKFSRILHTCILYPIRNLGDPFMGGFPYYDNLWGSFYEDFPCFYIHEYYVQGAILGTDLKDVPLFLHTCIPLSSCKHGGYFYGGFSNFYLYVYYNLVAIFGAHLTEVSHILHICRPYTLFNV